MEWIAFADRRPNHGARVLAYADGMAYPVIARFFAGDPYAAPGEDVRGGVGANAYEWIDPQGDGYGFPSAFSHWLPLPAPPIVATP
jgi:hypothetical protein